jgi:hypothetical protein
MLKQGIGIGNKRQSYDYLRNVLLCVCICVCSFFNIILVPYSSNVHTCGRLVIETVPSLG